MANINLKNVLHLPEGRTEAHFGNCTKTCFNLTTAAGIITNSDKATAVGIGDVVRLGVINSGSRLIDMVATISAVFTATTKGAIGFEYVDGVDSTDVPEDDDYFCAATSLAAVAVIRKTATTAPVVLPKDAYLIVTNSVAAQAAAGVLDIILETEQTGA